MATSRGDIVRLSAENSKNKRAWTLRLKGELLEAIRRAWGASDAECPNVFQNGGEPIGDFRKAWRAACQSVGLEELLVHDLRRSCARNLVRSGVPEVIAMRITGHVTRSMFDRYNIVSDDDVADAMERVSEYVTARATEATKIVPLPRRAA